MTMTREQWLEKRREFIGGSDAAAALGLSRFKTQLQLYQEKRGELQIEETEAMVRGQMLEPIVRDLYARKEGRELSDAAWVVSKTVPFMAATPDAIDDVPNSLVQIKTNSAWGRHLWGPDRSSQLPTDYMIQGQHEMAVLGAKRNRFAVLFADQEMFRALVWMIRGGVANDVILDYIEEQIEKDDSRCEFAVFPIERDDALITTIIEGETYFWEKYVREGVLPPDPSIPEKTKDYITADARQRKLIEKLRAAYEARDSAKEVYEQIAGAVKTEIGENAGMVAEGLAKIHYKAPTPKAKVDWESIAKEMRSSAPKKYDLLAKQHTKTVQGSRLFRPYWTE